MWVIKQLSVVILGVLVLAEITANAAGLPGLKHSLAGDYDPLERLRPMPVDGPWLAGRFAAVCGPALVVPKLDTPLSVAYKEHPFSAIDDAMVAARRANLPIPDLSIARLAADAGLTKEIPSLLETAVQRAPDDPEAYVLLADIAVREGRYTEAEQVYIKADDLRGKLAKDQSRDLRLRKAILSGRATVAEARENHALAQEYLEELLKLDPKDAAAMQQLARALSRQKKAKEALMAMREAYRIDAEHAAIPEIEIARFNAYMEGLGDANAKKWVQIALEKHPGDLRGWLVAGEWSLYIDDFREAHNRVEKALELAPKSLEAKLLRGIVALFEADYATAERYFTAALEQSPENYTARNDLALALLMQNDPAKLKRALGYAEANWRADPQGAEAAGTLAAVLYRLGRLDEAEKTLTSPAISDGPLAENLYYLARIACDRGRKAEAKKLVNECLRIWPPHLIRPEAEALQERLEK
jgi:cytochrome c-type biogenesis protein CcmH/NrfG